MGPLTPVESFNALKKAAQTGETGKVVKLLSRESLRKIKLTLEDLKTLEEKQAANLARIYGISENSIKNLSVEDFLKVYLENKGNILLKILKYDPVKINLRGPEAEIQVENGMNIYFLKEEPYWKLDFTRL
jgi:hypothetical protein